MKKDKDQPKLLEILTMSPVRPFPDDPYSISRILAYLGKSIDQVAFESGVTRTMVSHFISNNHHSPKVALWFEKHGVYLDREYPDPTRKANGLLDRVSA